MKKPVLWGENAEPVKVVPTLKKYAIRLTNYCVLKFSDVVS